MSKEEDIENVDPTEINLYALHIDFRDQAKLRREALIDVGKKQDEVRRKKSYMEFRKSRIGFEYNTGVRKILDAEENEIKKPTVGTLKSAVDSDEELYKLEEELNILLRELDTELAYSKSISDRKNAIEGEIELWKAGYYAEPKEKVDNRLDG
ncbi:hypothetical protein KAR91_45545, partial [Candidatus Pacearchaeota archaeon]|nr:hypothetical protein [Candidatus Pacearchaeota archaeon]